MPDVRLKDGTIIKNVPAGTTQSELLARVEKMRANPLQPFNRDPANTTAMGPADEDPGITQKMFQDVSRQAQAIEEESPWVNRQGPLDLKKGLPFMGGLAGSFLGPAGSGMGALAASSLLAGGGAAVGELGRQKLSDEDLSVSGAAREGAATAAGNLAGGVILKGLSAAARKLFSSSLDDPARAAAQFAKEKGAPFPLSSAAPGSRAGNIQQGTRLLLPGEIKTQVDANRVAQFLNREVANIQAGGSPIDEAAVKGQQFLRQVFEPGETVYTQTFKAMREAVGDNTAVPLANTAQAIQGAAEALKARAVTGSLAQQIQTLAKRPSSQMTAQQVDDLYGELLRKAGKNSAARAEMNVVLSALVKDVDDFGKQFGMSFADDVAKASAVREEFRELRKIPALERLSKDFGGGGTAGSRQWMAELFGNPNGKALAELRARNPELYRELADSWLASNIGKFSRTSDGAIGRILDGKGLRGWYEQNADKLKLILGSPQAKALDNFSNYASHMSGAVSRAATGKGMDPTNLFPRAAAEGTAAVFTSPYLMLPGEAGSYVLARGLSDPNSTLFRLFTEGVKPSTMKFLETSAKFSGQAAGQRAENSR